MGLIHSRAGKKKNRAEAKYYKEMAKTEKRGRKKEEADDRREEIAGAEADSVGAHPLMQPTLRGMFAEMNRRRAAKKDQGE